MRPLIWILPILLRAASTQRTDLAETCYPKVPGECPSDPIEECPTCCCESSDNVEFYNPDAPVPECTAPPALYDIKLMYTWSEVCHPDYYFDSSQWDVAVGATHTSAYRLWDACMVVSEGVLAYSETGALDQIRNELINEGIRGNLLDLITSPSVEQGTGLSSTDVVVDKNYQFVSVISRQVPSADHVIGVADLRLCDGDKWRETVTICMELFSTGEASDDMTGEMERESVQENNCSFGYIEFDLKEISQYIPRTSLEENCYPMVPDKCPRSDPIEECPTCCCESSDNVEFYDPDAPEPECSAPDAAYRATFTATWTDICHPDYYPDGAAFTPTSVVSHNPEYRMWDACMDNASIGVGVMAQTGALSSLQLEYNAAGDTIGSSTTLNIIFGGAGSDSSNLTIDKDHQYVSVGSMLAPSADRMVGIADLRLCDGDKWREKVKLCIEPFSTATASERVAPKMERNSVQVNNCSFGYMEFTLLKDQTASSVIVTGVNIISLVVLALGMALCQ